MSKTQACGELGLALLSPIAYTVVHYSTQDVGGRVGAVVRVESVRAPLVVEGAGVPFCRFVREKDVHEADPPFSENE